MIRQAVILAAGEGQRLQPFTRTKPKVMIEVANSPILEWVVGALRDVGIRDIIIVVGYKSERVLDYFGDGTDFGVEIRYAVQKQQLGTAHALRQAEDLVLDEFILLSGDNIIDGETLASVEEPWSLVYKRVDEISKYGAVQLDDGRVVKITEKPAGDDTTHFANTGIYALKREIFDRIGDETSMVAVLNLLARDLDLRGVESRGLWMDVVYPWDILRVNSRAIQFSGRTVAGRVEAGTRIIGDVQIGANTVIRGNTYIRGPVIIGKGCEIGPNAVIMPSTSIGDNVMIGSHAYITNSVINGGVRIAPGSFIERTVISRGCVIGARFTAESGMAEVKVGREYHCVETGIFIGEDCRIGANVTGMPGTILGNRSSVGSMKEVHGIIPDRSNVL